MEGKVRIILQCLRLKQLPFLIYVMSTACKHQCDPSVPPEAAAAVWWYSAAKNKAGMRRRKRINRMRLIKNMTMNGNKVRPGDVGMIPGLNE
jgi:hypothetical protein